ncbi:MAG: hypothetical protein ACK5AL_03265 [Planctomycetota bacterium]|jgi:hypothetical protein
MEALPDTLLLLLAGLATVLAARWRRLAKAGQARPSAVDRATRAA